MLVDSVIYVLVISYSFISLKNYYTVLYYKNSKYLNNTETKFILCYVVSW